MNLLNFLHKSDMRVDDLTAHFQTLSIHPATQREPHLLFSEEQLYSAVELSGISLPMAVIRIILLYAGVSDDFYKCSDTLLVNWQGTRFVAKDLTAAVALCTWELLRLNTSFASYVLGDIAMQRFHQATDEHTEKVNIDTAQYYLSQVNYGNYSWAARLHLHHRLAFTYAWQGDWLRERIYHDLAEEAFLKLIEPSPEPFLPVPVIANSINTIAHQLEQCFKDNQSLIHLSAGRLLVGGWARDPRACFLNSRDIVQIVLAYDLPECALSYYDREVKRFPNSEDSYVNLAKVYLIQCLFFKATQMFRMALSKGPSRSNFPDRKIEDDFQWASLCYNSATVSGEHAITMIQTFHAEAVVHGDDDVTMLRCVDLLPRRRTLAWSTQFIGPFFTGPRVFQRLAVMKSQFRPHVHFRLIEAMLYWQQGPCFIELLQNPL
ncbi:MAG TPA: hypothetical protein VN457_05800, partial [Chlamydiales bacterium]|nr:hypothetical protein [Chlamydiales bacterium]